MKQKCDTWGSECQRTAVYRVLWTVKGPKSEDCNVCGVHLNRVMASATNGRTAYVYRIVHPKGAK